MLRSSLMLTSLVAFGATAQAQQVLPNRVQTVTGTPRDAGIYHVATGTWTRKANMADLGADVIYNNTWPFTAGTTSYGTMTGDIFIDEGRIPSPSSPNSLSSKPGCAATYNVEGVQFGYCTDQVAGGNWTLNFFNSYTLCAASPGGAVGTVTIAGPGSALGPVQCWIVTVDDATSTFVMQADGDGTYAAPVGTNLFGWEMISGLPGASAAGTGPILRGDPATSLQYDGTRWDSPINYLEDGTGMSSGDAFRVDGGPTTPGCYWYGGTPFASFHLRIFADACGAPATGTAFCDGVSGLACPCFPGVPNGAVGNGCPNSVNASGSNLSATGNPSVSNDTVVLNSTLTPNASVLFFQGTVQNGTPAGNGTLFGDGKRCAGGTVIRLGTKTAALGNSSYPVGADLSVSVKGVVAAGNTRTYQAWYRNAAAFCTTNTFNLSNGFQIVWGM